MDKFYFEICIFPNAFFDIFVSEIADFTSQAIEIDDENAQIVLRTSKNLESTIIPFLDQLCTNLSQINNTHVDYKYSIWKRKVEDYMDIYRKSIGGLECGDFYIHPSWIKPKDSKINILLEPSLAFGTGHHASTFMSIESIMDCIKNRFSFSPTLLDVGCGSGILSLCAYKLGASVSLCDIDALAINEAKKNFLANNATITEIWLGSLARVHISYYIVVANIVASVIIEQANNLLSSLSNNAFLILSGILDEYADLVKDRFACLHLIEEKTKDEWVTLVLQNTHEQNNK